MLIRINLVRILLNFPSLRFRFPYSASALIYILFFLFIHVSAIILSLPHSYLLKT